MATVTVTVGTVSWIDEDGDHNYTIGDVIDAPEWVLESNPDAFKETGGTWTPPVPTPDLDLDKLKENITSLISDGVKELVPTLKAVDEAIVVRDIPPAPVDPETIPIMVTPAELKDAGVPAKVIAVLVAEDN